MRFMQTESVLQTKNRSGLAKNRFSITLVLKHLMMRSKIQSQWPLVPEKKIFLGFYHIWAWQPSWLCDQDHLRKLSFPHPIEALYEI